MATKASYEDLLKCCLLSLVLIKYSLSEEFTGKVYQECPQINLSVNHLASKTTPFKNYLD
jgi:hypothetical protein